MKPFIKMDESEGLNYWKNSKFQVRERAIKLYKQVLKSEPNDPITWDNLGLAYEYKKEYDNAKEAYQKAHELDPDDSEIKDHLEDIQNK